MLHSILGEDFTWISIPMVHISTPLTCLLIGHHVLLSFSCCVVTWLTSLPFRNVQVISSCRGLLLQQWLHLQLKGTYVGCVTRPNRSSTMCIINACLCPPVPWVSQNQVTSDLNGWDLLWCYGPELMSLPLLSKGSASEVLHYFVVVEPKSQLMLLMQILCLGGSCHMTGPPEV